MLNYIENRLHYMADHRSMVRHILKKKKDHKELRFRSWVQTGTRPVLNFLPLMIIYAHDCYVT